jgi:hypothetical protein
MSTPLSQLPEVGPDESVSQVFNDNDPMVIDDDDEDIYGTPWVEPAPQHRSDRTSEAARGATPTAFSELFNPRRESYLVVTNDNKNDPRIVFKVLFMISFVDCLETGV